MIVRSYMAHHAGMSLLAAANALTGGVFVRRFCEDREMRAALSLLEERVPTGAGAVRVRRGKQKPARRTDRDGGGVSPDAGLFSDGEVTLLCDACGRNRLRYAGMELLGYSRRSAGAFTAARVDGKLTPLAGRKPFTLHPTCCLREEILAGVRVQTALALLKNTAAMALPIKLTNTDDKEKKVDFLWYFEPKFTRSGQPDEHPAFSDLGIRAAYDPACAALLFWRERDGAAGPFLAAALSDRTPMLYECDRETVLGCDPTRLYPFEKRIPTFDCDPSFRFPAAAIKATATLRPGEKLEKILLLIPGASRTEVREKTAALRRSRLPEIRRAVRGLPLNGNAAGEAAKNLLLRACFGGQPAGETQKPQAAAPLSALWEKGISGDLPLLRAETDGVPPQLLRALIKTHRRLTDCGVRSDLILCTAQPADYADSGFERLRALLRDCGEKETRGPGGVRLVNRNDGSPAFLAALASAPGAAFPDGEKLRPAPPETDAPLQGTPLFEGENGFVPGGYFIRDKGDRPWCHTLSNPVFGTLLSARSPGCTWAMNARLNRLTPWSNDVCTDLTGEQLLLLTENAVYDCISGASVYFYDNRAVYGSRCGATDVRVTVQVDRRAMKKRLRVEYKTRTTGPLRFVYRILPYAADNDVRAAGVRIQPAENAAVFYNPFNTEYPGCGAVCADRPAIAQTDGRALTLQVTPARAEDGFAFYLAFSASKTGLKALCALPFRPCEERRVTLRAGDTDADTFGSALLFHQAYDTRLLARTGFYQCSGAYGYRDQLQDAMNLCRWAPDRAAVQIMRCAAAQFPEGDALHWFHQIPAPKPRKKGVRTRCSDDMLWLPLAAARYVEATGDTEILWKKTAFLSGEALTENETERYGDYFPGPVRASVYVHCLRAIDAAAGAGVRGLPLMKGGDWNDAFGEVGIGGRGESVWLAMFLRLVCRAFAPVCAAAKDGENEEKLRRLSERMERAVLEHAWNGKYFLRGFYDDGTALGGEESGACKIDLLPQAFASLADVGTPEQRKSALREAFDRLYDRESGVLRLFDPPFTAETKRAGYVNDYPPGVRENGGQYTHAAVWFVRALLKEGMADEARAALRAVLPNTRTGAQAEIFANEPYALTADVRYGGKFTGAGGWSLYTGAAGALAALLAELSDRALPD